MGYHLILANRLLNSPFCQEARVLSLEGKVLSLEGRVLSQEGRVLSQEDRV